MSLQEKRFVPETNHARRVSNGLELISTSICRRISLHFRALT